LILSEKKNFYGYVDINAYYNPDYLWYNFRGSPVSENSWLFNNQIFKNFDFNNKVFRDNNQKSFIWNANFDYDSYSSLRKSLNMSSTFGERKDNIFMDNYEYFHPLRVLNEKYLHARIRASEKQNISSAIISDLDFLKASLLNLGYEGDSWKRFYLSDYYENFTYHILLIVCY